TAWQLAGVGDFNGDGNTDLVWRATANGAMEVWYQNGTAYLGYASLPTVPLNMTLAAVADFTGDGKPDLVWQNTRTGAAELWTMDGVTRTAVTALSVQGADANWHP